MSLTLSIQITHIRGKEWMASFPSGLKKGEWTVQQGPRRSVDALLKLAFPGRFFDVQRTPPSLFTATERVPREKQIGLGMDTQLSCVCGKEKAKGQIVCTECWNATPAALRSQLRSQDQAERHAAARLILERVREGRTHGTER